MKILAFFFLSIIASFAAPRFHEEVFGQSLGGWSAKGKRASDYELSGSRYRTWKPEVTPLVDGGIYISVRIDHLRGMLSSNDHANLELTVDAKGNVVSARSSLALQGKKVTSDLIRGTGNFSTNAAGLQNTAKIGADLVADLSAKITRENIAEAGRVTFPSAVQHNYNLLCLSIGVDNRKALPLDENGQPIELQGPTAPQRGEEVVDDRKVAPLSR